MGRREEAEKLMAEAPVLRPNRRGHFQYALAYAGFGDKDRTIAELESWTGVGPVRVGLTLTAPEFAFLHGDPSRESPPQEGRLTGIGFMR